MKFICLQKFQKSYNTIVEVCFISVEKPPTSFHHNTGYIERFITMNTVKHPIPPVFDSSSRILILGSFPSVKSREGHFSIIIRRTGSGRLWPASSRALSPSPLMRKGISSLPSYRPLGRDRILLDRRFQRQLHPRCRAQRPLPDPVCRQYSGDLLQWEDFLELL